MTVKKQITGHRRSRTLTRITFFIYWRAKIVICVIWHSKKYIFDEFL